MNNNQPSTNKPTLYAYQVRDTSDGKGYWTRIGAAWPTKSGGFSIQLESLPLDGRIVCQPPREDTNDQ